MLYFAVLIQAQEKRVFSRDVKKEASEWVKSIPYQLDYSANLKP